MQEFCGIRTEKYFREQIIKPMLEAKLIAKTVPDKPTSAKQKYVSKKRAKYSLCKYYKKNAGKKV